MKFLLTVFLSLAFLNVLLTQPRIAEKTENRVSEEALPVLMVFSGSDWCKPCIKLKKEVLEAPEFQAFAQERMEIRIVDFPYKKANQLSKEQQAINESLAEQYNPGGLLPNAVLLNGDGQMLRKIRSRTLKNFIKEIEKEL